MKKILIDADGCPVVNITVSIAKEKRLECIIVCDTSHILQKDGAKTITVSKGADSADFTLVNLISENDIVITQDYGLAVMCMAKKATVINQDGMLYTDENIDTLLYFRHTAKKIRNAGGRLKGPAKRTVQQDKDFKMALYQLVDL